MEFIPSSEVKCPKSVYFIDIFFRHCQNIFSGKDG